MSADSSRFAWAVRGAWGDGPSQASHGTPGALDREHSRRTLVNQQHRKPVWHKAGPVSRHARTVGGAAGAGVVGPQSVHTHGAQVAARTAIEQQERHRVAELIARLDATEAHERSTAQPNRNINERELAEALQQLENDRRSLREREHALDAMRTAAGHFIERSPPRAAGRHAQPAAHGARRLEYAEDAGDGAVRAGNATPPRTHGTAPNRAFAEASPNAARYAPHYMASTSGQRLILKGQQPTQQLQRQQRTQSQPPMRGKLTANTLDLVQRAHDDSMLADLSALTVTPDDEQAADSHRPVSSDAIAFFGSRGGSRVAHHHVDAAASDDDRASRPPHHHARRSSQQDHDDNDNAVRPSRAPTTRSATPTAGLIPFEDVQARLRGLWRELDTPLDVQRHITATLLTTDSPWSRHELNLHFMALAREREIVTAACSSLVRREQRMADVAAVSRRYSAFANAVAASAGYAGADLHTASTALRHTDSMANLQKELVKALAAYRDETLTSIEAVVAWQQHTKRRGFAFRGAMVLTTMLHDLYVVAFRGQPALYLIPVDVAYNPLALPGAEWTLASHGFDAESLSARNRAAFDKQRAIGVHGPAGGVFVKAAPPQQQGGSSASHNNAPHGVAKLIMSQRVVDALPRCQAAMDALRDHCAWLCARGQANIRGRCVRRRVALRAAAVPVIQRAWRCSRARATLWALKHAWAYALLARVGRCAAVRARLRRVRYGAVTAQRIVRGFIARCRLFYRVAAATAIQRTVRAMLGRVAGRAARQRQRLVTVQRVGRALVLRCGLGVYSRSRRQTLQAAVTQLASDEAAGRHAVAKDECVALATSSESVCYRTALAAIAGAQCATAQRASQRSVLAELLLQTQAAEARQRAEAATLEHMTRAALVAVATIQHHATLWATCAIDAVVTAEADCRRVLLGTAVATHSAFVAAAAHGRNFAVVQLMEHGHRAAIATDEAATRSAVAAEVTAARDSMAAARQQRTAADAVTVNAAAARCTVTVAELEAREALHRHELELHAAAATHNEQRARIAEYEESTRRHLLREASGAYMRLCFTRGSHRDLVALGDEESRARRALVQHGRDEAEALADAARKQRAHGMFQAWLTVAAGVVSLTTVVRERRREHQAAPADGRRWWHRRTVTPVVPTAAEHTGGAASPPAAAPAAAGPSPTARPLAGDDGDDDDVVLHTSQGSSPRGARASAEGRASADSAPPAAAASVDRDDTFLDECLAAQAAAIESPPDQKKQTSARASPPPAPLADMEPPTKPYAERATAAPPSWSLDDQPEFLRRSLLANIARLQRCGRALRVRRGAIAVVAAEQRLRRSCEHAALAGVVDIAEWCGRGALTHHRSMWAVETLAVARLGAGLAARAARKRQVLQCKAAAVRLVLQPALRKRVAVQREARRRSAESSAARRALEDEAAAALTACATSALREHAQLTASAQSHASRATAVLRLQRVGRRVLLLRDEARGRQAQMHAAARDRLAMAAEMEKRGAAVHHGWLGASSNDCFASLAQRAAKALAARATSRSDKLKAALRRHAAAARVRHCLVGWIMRLAAVQLLQRWWRRMRRVRRLQAAVRDIRMVVVQRALSAWVLRHRLFKLQHRREAQLRERQRSEAAAAIARAWRRAHRLQRETSLREHRAVLVQCMMRRYIARRRFRAAVAEKMQQYEDRARHEAALAIQRRFARRLLDKRRQCGAYGSAMTTAEVTRLRRVQCAVLRFITRIRINRQRQVAADKAEMQAVVRRIAYFWRRRARSKERVNMQLALSDRATVAAIMIQRRWRQEAGRRRIQQLVRQWRQEMEARREREAAAVIVRYWRRGVRLRQERDGKPPARAAPSLTAAFGEGPTPRVGNKSPPQRAALKTLSPADTAALRRPASPGDADARSHSAPSLYDALEDDLLDDGTSAPPLPHARSRDDDAGEDSSPTVPDRPTRSPSPDGSDGGFVEEPDDNDENSDDEWTAQARLEGILPPRAVTPRDPPRLAERADRAASAKTQRVAHPSDVRTGPAPTRTYSPERDFTHSAVGHDDWTAELYDDAGLAAPADTPRRRVDADRGDDDDAPLYTAPRPADASGVRSHAQHPSQTTAASDRVRTPPVDDGTITTAQRTPLASTQAVWHGPRIRKATATTAGAPPKYSAAPTVSSAGTTATMASDRAAAIAQPSASPRAIPAPSADFSASRLRVHDAVNTTRVAAGDGNARDSDRWSPLVEKPVERSVVTAAHSERELRGTTVPPPPASTMAPPRSMGAPAGTTSVVRVVREPSPPSQKPPPPLAAASAEQRTTRPPPPGVSAARTATYASGDDDGEVEVHCAPRRSGSPAHSELAASPPRPSPAAPSPATGRQQTSRSDGGGLVRPLPDHIASQMDQWAAEAAALLSTTERYGAGSAAVPSPQRSPPHATSPPLLSPPRRVQAASPAAASSPKNAFVSPARAPYIEVEPPSSPRPAHQQQLVTSYNSSRGGSLNHLHPAARPRRVSWVEELMQSERRERSAQRVSPAR